MNLYLESVTLEQFAAERERARQRKELEKRAARRFAGDAGNLLDGVLFAKDENLFSGPAAEREQS